MRARARACTLLCGLRISFILSYARLLRGVESLEAPRRQFVCEWFLDETPKREKRVVAPADRAPRTSVCTASAASTRHHPSFPFTQVGILITCLQRRDKPKCCCSSSVIEVPLHFRNLSTFRSRCLLVASFFRAPADARHRDPLFTPHSNLLFRNLDARGPFRLTAAT